MDRERIAALYGAMFCENADETARCAEIADAVTDSVEEKLRDPTAAGGVEEALPRRLELRREAREAERLRRLRPDDLERQRHGDGLDGLLADGTVHGAARPRGRGPRNALPAAAGRGRRGLAR